jgi:hypothetical protein
MAMVQQSPALLELTTKLAGIDTVNFLVYHHAARNGRLDSISQCVQDFRSGTEPQTSRWLSLIKELAGDSGTYDVVVRALGSYETSVGRGSPLDRLCELIARHSDSHYQPARLTKTRITRKLQGLGGRAAHQKELVGAYAFDGLGLRSDARILVIDDLISTGATLEAIAAAIHAALPAAVVSGFVLSKAGTASSSNTIDPEYFVSATAAIVPRANATAPSRTGQRGGGSKGRSAKSEASKKPLPAQKQSPLSSRRTTYIMTVVGVLLAAVIIGAILPHRPAAKERAAEISGETLTAMIKETETQRPQPAETVAAKAAVPEHKNLHPGIVTTPSIGLRTNHSVDARCLRGTVVRLGERVEILRRHIADSGPDWVQVRTKGGQVGWAMASTITEPRRRE